MNLIKFYLFLINLIIIIINIKFLISEFKFKAHIKINPNVLYNFKNSDHFILDLMNNGYIEISKFLLRKYNYHKCFKKFGFFSIFLRIRYFKRQILNYINKNIINSKKKINLYSVDLFSFEFHKKWLEELLKDKFIIKFNENKPDYLIYNVFGTEHLNPKYNNCIKIAIYTENTLPDFNEADYLIGHYHINYLDRYFKFSIFFWHIIDDNYFSFFRNNVINNPIRRKFCIALISNNFVTDGFRVNFINELSKYKKVDMGGKYNNNIGMKVENKTEFLKSYKFSISMENTEGNGYLSEKIVDSFLSGTIPIYYGDYMIDEYINPKSYILIKGEKDIL